MMRAQRLLPRDTLSGGITSVIRCSTDASVGGYGGMSRSMASNEII